MARSFALNNDARDLDDTVDRVRGLSTAHLVLESGD